MTDDEPAGEPGAGDRPDAAHRSGLSDHTQQRIGNQLRNLYDSLVQQPIPDRFRDLIARLDDEPPQSGDLGGV